MRKLIVYLVYKVFLRFTLDYFIGLKYVNKEEVLKHQQYILIANHNSHLDALSLMSVLPWEQMLNTYPAAAKDYFGRNKLFKWFSENILNLLLIDRKKTEHSPNPISLMDAKLKAGHSILLFPEGSRGEPEVIQPFKKGIALLAHLHPELPIIPIFTYGLGKNMPKGSPIPVPHNAYIWFGPPLQIPIGQTTEQTLKTIESSYHAFKDQALATLQAHLGQVQSASK